MTLEEFRIMWFAWREENEAKDFPQFCWAHGYTLCSFLPAAEERGSQSSWFSEWKEKYRIDKQIEEQAKAQDEFPKKEDK